MEQDRSCRLLPRTLGLVEAAGIDSATQRSCERDERARLTRRRDRSCKLFELRDAHQDLKRGSASLCARACTEPPVGRLRTFARDRRLIDEQAHVEARGLGGVRQGALRAGAPHPARADEHGRARPQEAPAAAAAAEDPMPMPPPLAPLPGSRYELTRLDASAIVARPHRPSSGNRVVSAARSTRRAVGLNSSLRVTNARPPSVAGAPPL